MAKSRVEKNKDLYNEIELESLKIEESETDVKEKGIPEEEIKEEIVKTEEKKQEVVTVEEVETEEVKKEEPVDIPFEVEQPISYTDKLSVEEILRAKLENQEKLKNDKKNYKRSPVAEGYSAEMMQKNISQAEGVDVRKEANIKVRHNNNVVIALLVLLLVVVVAAGAVAIILLRK